MWHLSSPLCPKGDGGSKGGNKTTDADGAVGGLALALGRPSPGGRRTLFYLRNPGGWAAAPKEDFISSQEGTSRAGSPWLDSHTGRCEQDSDRQPPFSPTPPDS